MICKVEIVIYYWIRNVSVLECVNDITKVSKMYEPERYPDVGGLYGVRCRLGAGVHLADVCLSKAVGSLL